MNKNKAATVVIAEGAYMVGYADRDVSGYTPTTYIFDSHEHAKACAASINAAWGLTPTQALEIVASSMRERS